MPLNNNNISVYTDKTDQFFKDLYSKDSTVMAKARNSISYIYYAPENLNKIISFVNDLNYGEKDYFDMKSKFIYELGYIKDSCCTDKVVNALNNIYKKHC